jgi:hypothetical protein
MLAVLHFYSNLLDIENDDVVLMAARALETLYLKLKMDVLTSEATRKHSSSIIIKLNTQIKTNM